MTVKRINFTGRRRVANDRVEIHVLDGHPRTFDATINLQGLSFLPQAAVYLEASCAGSTVTERFSFGEVASIQPPNNRALTRLEGENVWFTLKVVDRTERFGRILGIAEHIRPKSAGKQTVAGRRGILPIEPVDLGEQLWRLEFREHDVFLLVNKDVPGLSDRMRSDPLIYAAVYPEIVRQILIKAIDENMEMEEAEDRWPILWLRFGRELHPTKQAPPNPDDSDDDREDWVHEVVENFCETHKLREKFLTAMTGTGGDQ